LHPQTSLPQEKPCALQLLLQLPQFASFDPTSQPSSAVGAEGWEQLT